jgi:2-aminoethylphosphonate-pyruvate transaminase
MLLVPGPVSTHPIVREAMNQDIAPWDRGFRALYARVLERIRLLARGVEGVHVALPLQGCGHFGLEAALRTFVPLSGKILIPMTGVYGERLARLARESRRAVVPLEVQPSRRIDAADLTRALAEDESIGHVAFVYSETGTGIVHDARALCAAARGAGRRALVDAMSAFGALPLPLDEHPEVDAVVFTPNKCLEAIAGISITVARIDRLEASEGNAESWSLDLSDLYRHLKRFGFGTSRFTPPPQVVAALSAALDLHTEEGQEGRLTRYRANMETLYDAMLGFGLTPCLERRVQGPIVLNVYAPAHPAWNLGIFVDMLRDRGMTISDFFYTREPSFRLGCIGALTPSDMARAAIAMGDVLHSMGIRLPR